MVTYTFTNGTQSDADEVNQNFTDVETKADNFSPPIGSVLSWLKSLTNTPALPTGWVECNGQTISDSDSVYDGVTIPDLNGGNRFLRGNATSGTTGGSATHNHQWAKDNSSTGKALLVETGTSSGTTNHSFNSSGVLTDFLEQLTSGKLNANYYTNNASTLPPYYNIVWIMRIK